MPAPVAATPVRIAWPLPGVGSRTTRAPWLAATLAVSSMEALSITITSSTSVASRAAWTTAPTVAASFHAGITAATCAGEGDAGDKAGAVRLVAIAKGQLYGSVTACALPAARAVTRPPPVRGYRRAP